MWNNCESQAVNCWNPITNLRTALAVGCSVQTRLSVKGCLQPLLCYFCPECFTSLLIYIPTQVLLFPFTTSSPQFRKLSQVHVNPEGSVWILPPWQNFSSQLLSPTLHVWTKTWGFWHSVSCGMRSVRESLFPIRWHTWRILILWIDLWLCFIQEYSDVLWSTQEEMAKDRKCRMNKAANKPHSSSGGLCSSYQCGAVCPVVGMEWGGRDTTPENDVSDYKQCRRAPWLQTRSTQLFIGSQPSSPLKAMEPGTYAVLHAPLHCQRSLLKTWNLVPTLCLLPPLLAVSCSFHDFPVCASCLPRTS